MAVKKVIVTIAPTSNFHGKAARRGELAKSNAQLVERIVTVIRDLGFEPASPEEAREMLGMAKIGSREHIENRMQTM